MELYVVAAGHVDSLNRWQQDLTSQFLPIYKDGKKVPKMKRRLLVAPVQLYKIVFAKEEQERVLQMVCPQDYMTHRYKFLGYSINVIRKFLGLKKCPIPDKVDAYLQPNIVDKAVAVMPLGLKDDVMFNGIEQI